MPQSKVGLSEGILELRVGEGFAEVRVRACCWFVLGGIENLAAVETLKEFLVFVLGDENRAQMFARLRRHSQSWSTSKVQKSAQL